MKLTNEGIDLIKHFEGKIIDRKTELHRAYVCPANFWTIGWGHLILGDNGLPMTNNPNIKYCGKTIACLSYDQLPDKWKLIDDKEADRLLKISLEYFCNKLKDLISQELTDNQFSALVSFCYNLGEGNFRRSTLRTLINTNPNDAGIGYQFSRWNKGGGKILPGLTRRRKAEYELYCRPDVEEMLNKQIKENMMCKAENNSLLYFITQILKVKLN